jgi:hypothetical protein
MWDSLGSSVDINLDNLSPHSKGTKTNSNNLPMNALKMNIQSGNNINNNNSPLSPKISSIGKDMAVQSQSRSQTANDLFQFQ